MHMNDYCMEIRKELQLFCEFCKKETGNHASGCPNADEQESLYSCYVCECGIHPGEKYIVNDDLETAHWECINHKRDLLEFLNYEINIMEDEN